MTASRGRVILVGAGPGDPELITLRGKRALESADVVVYDALANTALLDYAPASAERIYAGKKPGGRALEQNAINELLAAKAQAGLCVVRLKGGDPYLFGRGGEEAAFLAERHIDFEVVPGISAAMGAAAAGIPLTDRRCASSVAFVTGHEDPAKPGPSVRWEHLAKGADTLVVYMGVERLSQIARTLIARGRAADTPASVVERATTPRQRVVRGVLGDIAGRASAAQVEPPALLIVGAVNKLGDSLNWFERRPLFGRRIVVTRARRQAGELSARLCELGAGVIEMPVIEIRPPENWDALDRAVREAASYDWLVFTSANGAEAFMGRLSSAGADVRRLGGVKVAAIGPATARELLRHGIRADFVPDEYLSDSLAAGLAHIGNLEGKRVLLARSDVAREDLKARLCAAGARVAEVVAYRTVPAEFDSEELARQVERGEVDAITFTSASTADYFVRRAGRAVMLNFTGRVAAASIGPVASAALRKLGIEPACEAKVHTAAGLADALVELLGQPKAAAKKTED